MKLIAHAVYPLTKRCIHPAPLEREWMSSTSSRFAYRCLPLNIANAHGWEITNKADFSAVWNGQIDQEAINLRPNRIGDNLSGQATSHFGHGVLTFHIPYLFETEPGYNLMVQGPVNSPKDGISPLTGIVEADWAPYTFTMNWRFTRPNYSVRFVEGEPICHIFPIKRGELEQFQPVIRNLSEDPEKHAKYEKWNHSRRYFIEDLSKPDSNAKEAGWQRHYLQGKYMDGNKPEGVKHQTSIKLKPFKVQE